MGRLVSVRILLADDQRLVRSGFRQILESEGFEVVGEAGDGNEAVALSRRSRPDVVLMDVRMPNLDGIEATRRIRSGPEPAPTILVLTTFDLDEYVYEALRAGASGFLLKDAPEEQLTAAVNVVADGGSLFAPSVTPPPRTVREVFPHTAHRHPSPGGVHGSVGHGFPADGSESARDQIALPREQRPPLVEGGVAFVFLAEEACDAIEAEAVDPVEPSRRVAVAEVAAPAA